MKFIFCFLFIFIFSEIAGVHRQQKEDMIPIKQILEDHSVFNSQLYSLILAHSKDIPVLLHSDIEHLMKSIHHDFPEQTKLESLGNSYKMRPILMLTLDARSLKN